MNWLPLLAMPHLADPTAADQQVGIWGGVVVMALVVGTLLLWLNMRKQLRKIDVPADHEDETPVEDAEAEARPEEAATQPEEAATQPEEKPDRA